MDFYSLLGVPCSFRILAGFLLTGFLLASPGALLPIWGYHIETDYPAIGVYFLSFAIGIIGAVEGRPYIPAFRPTAALLASACAMACGGLLLLAATPTSTPALWSVAWRMFGFLIIGASTGFANTGLMGALSPMYARDPGATVTVAGVFFGLGCLVAALLGVAAYYADLGSRMLVWGVWGAAIPACLGLLYFRARFSAPDVVGAATITQALMEFRSPATVLSALLLPIQFGNEWSFGGWLPLFLIHRIGISPETALTFLSVYWLVLLAGHIAAFRWLVHRRHPRQTLFLTAWAALFGCLILLKTDNQLGAWAGTLLVSAGFAALSPLIAGRIETCFHDYHPGFFNGVFAFAIAGGLLAPALLGWLADSAGIWVVVGLPLFGTAIVFALLLAIWINGKLGTRATT
ncbi:MAG: hypothetical protein M3Y07_04345 [Acidobacteriota bacterium]|nr:hypothetical protein [Acidobacteriota bacterium]